MLAEGEILLPRLREFRALRAWAGVRPLFDASRAGPKGSPPESAADSRLISRSHAVLDHEARDGVAGLVSVVGGKLTTFRLMAQEAVDLACEKMQVKRQCVTADTPIGPPGRAYQVHSRRWRSAEQRGDATGRLAPGDEIVCECELVTRRQVEEALAASKSPVLNDLRRDLRLGMGPCQAGFCAYRAVAILLSMSQSPIANHVVGPESGEWRLEIGDLNSAFVQFLQERWKGLRPVMWGANLKQLELDLNLYRNLLAADRLPLAAELEAYPTERSA